MRLSILSTLRATLVLWLRHVGFFVLLTFFIELPGHIPHRHPGGDFTAWNVFLGASRTVVPILLQTIGMAATLSLLSDSSGDKRWIVMARGIHRYSGQLLGVQVLLVVLSLLLILPFGILFIVGHAAFGLSILWIAFLQLILLLLLKYALANPLVVVENLKAPAALAVSWRMTRNRFAFVFGCYLIVAVTEWFLSYAAVQIHPSRTTAPMLAFYLNFLDTYWYVLPWIMYLRIKATDGEPVTAAAIE